MFYGFVANFTRFPPVHKFFENSLRFDKSYRAFEGGDFMRHSADKPADELYATDQ